ncbi:methanethiol S-methyltransferase [Leptobacterium sp. I13]|uniref:methanethiol S-methyltransferase n=1 Tax=Leptobacterium meishanense TaxID=3128904 RepID=UPI0030ECC2F4
MKRFIILLFGGVSYALFLAVFLYAVGFIGNLWVPKSIDSGVESDLTTSIIVNVALLSVFALQHSIMARPGFKKWWTKIIDPAAERSMYVFLTNLAFILIFWQWQPMKSVMWNVENETYAMIIHGIFWLGWFIVFISTFLINHFHLFGLLQVFENFKKRSLSDPNFKMSFLYGLVRHPIMLGFIIAFWATPVMTAGHLLFSVVSTAYIYVAVKYLEERDLMKLHGDTYAEYKKKVPMLIPFIKFRK